MPSIKEGESEKDYVSRCIPYVMKNEGLDAKAAAAKCHGMYKQNKEKGTQYTELKGEDAAKADAKRLNMAYEEYKPPESGNAPASVKLILKKAYSNCRRSYPEYSKERCSKIAWGAVKNAGWSKDEKGNWHKSESKHSEDIIEDFAFQCDNFEFIEEKDDEEVYRMTIAVANRFMHKIYMSKDIFKSAYKKFENTLHDINHQGTGYMIGLTVIPSQIDYIIGYQNNIQYDDNTGEITGDVHIRKKSSKYNDWKNYMEISKKIGRLPNVSMYINGKLKYIKAKELPQDSHYIENGYNDNDLVPCMTNMQPVAVSTVTLGSCNDKDGCGIKYSCDDGNCDIPSDEIEMNEKNKEYRKYLENRLKNLKKGD